LLFVLACFSLFNYWGHAGGSHFLEQQPLGFATCCLWIVFWIFCLKSLPNLIARVCIALSAGFSLAFCLYILVGALVRFVSLHSFPASLFGFPLILVLLSLPMAGFGSMLWVSLRPWSNSRLPSNFRGLVLFSNY
jgi:TRAP-type C4-dicarboxylate transport system permease small subunit